MSHESSRRGSIIRSLYGSGTTVEPQDSDVDIANDPFLGKLRR